MRVRLEFVFYLILLHFAGYLAHLVRDHAMSVASMKSLVEQERLFIAELANYTQALQSKINTIESFLAEVRSKKLQWAQGQEAFVAHPLNSYALLRRLHEDWSYFELYMSEPVCQENAENVKKLATELSPTILDKRDAMKGLVRLQSYYQLEVQQLVNGLIAGKQYDSQMTTLECFAMAQYCEEKQHLHHARSYYNEALERYNASNESELYEQVYKLGISEVLSKYAKMFTSTDQFDAALNVFDKGSDLYADLWLQRRAAEDSLFIDTQLEYVKDNPNPIQLGCQQLYEPESTLTCHLQHQSTYFTKLAPFKVEQLSLEPYVALYHDVIYDKEIKELLSVELSSLKHERAQRNSLKYTMLHKSAADILNTRVKDMTGMNVDEDENFVLMNYGIGGHRSTHSDSKPPHLQQLDLGNILTTVMFFLSDVPQGGATVFPYLNISVRPAKGNALVWHNLDNQLNPEVELEHLSCPVLVGNKWTLIKWLHERPQMFTSHCLRELEDEEGFY